MVLLLICLQRQVFCIWAVFFHCSVLINASERLKLLVEIVFCWTGSIYDFSVCPAAGQSHFLVCQVFFRSLQYVTFWRRGLWLRASWESGSFEVKRRRSALMLNEWRCFLIYGKQNHWHSWCRARGCESTCRRTEDLSRFRGFSSVSKPVKFFFVVFFKFIFLVSIVLSPLFSLFYVTRERNRFLHREWDGPEVYSIRCNLLSPAKPKDFSFDSIACLLKNYFDSAPLEITKSFHFGMRNQQPDETISDYIVALKKLSIHCSYELRPICKWRHERPLRVRVKQSKR